MARRWGYSLVLLPAIAEWLDKAAPPTDAWEIGKTAVLGAVIGIGLWRLYRDADKLKGINYKIGETKAPVVLDNAVAYLEARVIRELDVGTHTIFIGELVNSDVLSEEECLTYAHYHLVKGGMTPKAAPSYIREEKGG